MVLGEHLSRCVYEDASGDGEIEAGSKEQLNPDSPSRRLLKIFQGKLEVRAWLEDAGRRGHVCRAVSSFPSFPLWFRSATFHSKMENFCFTLLPSWYTASCESTVTGAKDFGLKYLTLWIKKFFAPLGCFCWVFGDSKQKQLTHLLTFFNIVNHWNRNSLCDSHRISTFPPKS